MVNVSSRMSTMLHVPGRPLMSFTLRTAFPSGKDKLDFWNEKRGLQQNSSWILFFDDALEDSSQSNLPSGKTMHSAFDPLSNRNREDNSDQGQCQKAILVF